MLPIADIIPTRTRPWITVGLVLALGLAFAGQATLTSSAQHALITGRGFLPAAPTLASGITALWLHENIVHLAGNLVALWVFGPSVEDRLGHGRFVGLYASGACAGWLAHLWAGAPDMLLVGSSGAVASVIGAHVALFPRARVLVPVPFDLVEVPAAVFMGGWLMLQSVGGLGAVGHLGPSGTALWVPVGGLAAGLALGRVLRRRERVAVEWWS